MNTKSKYKTVNFLLPAGVMQKVEMYCQRNDMSVSKWIRSIVKRHLVEKKVLDENGRLINGWGNPLMKGQKVVRHKRHEELLPYGATFKRNSDLYIGLSNYAHGNRDEAGNLSELIRFLIIRELELAGVTNKKGELTAAFKKVAQMEAA